MKKIIIALGLIGVLVIGTFIIVVNPFKQEIWEVNADKLSNSFQLISGDTVIDDLSKWTPFEWDTLYSFAPYTSKEKIYETVGYKWDNISETVNEGMNQLVFLNDGEVVCYLYGYPENTKLGFNFGKYEGSYIKLTTSDSLAFESTYIESNRVRYFTYIREN